MPGYKPLTQHQRTAGMDPRHRSLGYYGLEFHQKADTYHHEGRLWNDQTLRGFFSNGLLQHYVGTLSGFDSDLNYKEHQAYKKPSFFKSDYLDVKTENLYKGLGVDSNSDPSLSPSAFFEKVVDYATNIYPRLKQEDLLLNLGAEFQRYKQVAEFYQTLSRDEALPAQEREKIAAQAYLADKIADHLQTMIFNWVNDYSDQAKAFIKANLTKGAPPSAFNATPPDFLVEKCQELKELTSKFESNLDEKFDNEFIRKINARERYPAFSRDVDLNDKSRYSKLGEICDQVIRSGYQFRP